MRALAGRVRSRLSFANVVSVVALMVALGGTSYAVSEIGRNDVGAREIEKNAVRAKEVKNRSLGERELRFEAVAEHELDILGDPGAGGRAARQEVVVDNPVLLPPDGSFVPVAILELPPDLSQDFKPTQFHVTAFSQALAPPDCIGAVSVVTRVAVGNPAAPGFPASAQPVNAIPDMRADLNPAAGIAFAPIGLGGVITAEQTQFAQEPDLALLARAHYEQGAPACGAQILESALTAIRLTEDPPL